jgi:hypothetical protein
MAKPRKRKYRLVGLVLLALVIYFIVNHPITAANVVSNIWDGLGDIARAFRTFFFRLVLG